MTGDACYDHQRGVPMHRRDEVRTLLRPLSSGVPTGPRWAEKGLHERAAN